MQAYEHFDSPLRCAPAKTRETSWFWHFWALRRPARLPRRPGVPARAAAVPLAPAGGVGMRACGRDDPRVALTADTLKFPMSLSRVPE